MSATGLDIAKIGSTWMMSPETAALGEASGLPGRSFWACGRGGVLGDVDADVVSAAFGFVEPTLLRGLLAGRALNVSPAQAAAYFAEACCAWGSGHLGKVDDAKLNRLADLARKVAAASSPGVGALFAGWRAVPEPTTQPGGRAALALHVLREHRGGAHLSAVQAAGLTPLQSMKRGNWTFRQSVLPWTSPQVGSLRLKTAVKGCLFSSRPRMWQAGKCAIRSRFEPQSLVPGLICGSTTIRAAVGGFRGWPMC